MVLRPTHPPSPTKPQPNPKQITNELASIRKWRDEVGALRKELQGNEQADLYARVRKELDVSTLRDSLNKVCNLCMWWTRWVDLLDLFGGWCGQLNGSGPHIYISTTTIPLK